LLRVLHKRNKALAVVLLSNISSPAHSKLDPFSEQVVGHCAAGELRPRLVWNVMMLLGEVYGITGCTTYVYTCSSKIDCHDTAAQEAVACVLPKRLW